MNVAECLGFIKQAFALVFRNLILIQKVCFYFSNITFLFIQNGNLWQKNRKVHTERHGIHVTILIGGDALNNNPFNVTDPSICI